MSDERLCDLGARYEINPVLWCEVQASLAEAKRLLGEARAVVYDTWDMAQDEDDGKLLDEIDAFLRPGAGEEISTSRQADSDTSAESGRPAESPVESPAPRPPAHADTCARHPTHTAGLCSSEIDELPCSCSPPALRTISEERDAAVPASAATGDATGGDTVPCDDCKHLADKVEALQENYGEAMETIRDLRTAPTRDTLAWWEEQLAVRDAKIEKFRAEVQKRKDEVVRIIKREAEIITAAQREAIEAAAEEAVRDWHPGSPTKLAVQRRIRALAGLDEEETER